MKRCDSMVIHGDCSGLMVNNGILMGNMAFIWLVVFKYGFDFSFHIWDLIHQPLTNSYFSRWLKPQTGYDSNMF